jgi:hypothetical protein
VANNDLPVSAYAPQGLKHGLTGIRGCRENLEDLKLTVLKIDAIGERAPCINCYAHTDPADFLWSLVALALFIAAFVMESHTRSRWPGERTAKPGPAGATRLIPGTIKAEEFPRIIAKPA